MTGFEELVAARLRTTGGRWLCAGVDLRQVMPRAASWWRTGHEGRFATAFPPDGPWDGVVLRLPRAKEEAAMTIELCAARLAPGGELWAGGPQAEGAKGVAGRLGQWFAEVEDEVYGGHARAAVARAPRSDLRADPEAFRADVELPLPSGLARLASWPGLFAHGRLDAGTELLISVLPQVTGLRVLDLGCGAGVLGHVLASSGPSSLDLCDVDALAVHAARLNVPTARVELCDGLPARGGPWDLVVSNPPLHTGAQMDPSLLGRLAEGLRGRLSRSGTALLVTHRTVPIERVFTGVTRGFERVAERSPYVVWRLSA